MLSYEVLCGPCRGATSPSKIIRSRLLHTVDAQISPEPYVSDDRQPLLAKSRQAGQWPSAAGLEPLDFGPYRDFEHRVESSIRRDIVVAIKP